MTGDRLPDPQDAATFADCIASTAHLNTLVGLMAQRGVQFVHVPEARSQNGAPWAAIVVQGPAEVALLRDVAERVARLLLEQRLADRSRALEG